MSRNTPVRKLISISAAAEHCDVNERTVRRWITEGRITGYRVGRRLVKVNLHEVERRAITVIAAAGVYCLRSMDHAAPPAVEFTHLAGGADNVHG